MVVRMKKNEDAVTMLTALTTFFKTGLNKGRDTIPLSQEVLNVQSYMTIRPSATRRASPARRRSIRAG